MKWIGLLFQKFYVATGAAGLFLIILSISSGLNVPGFQQITPDDECRAYGVLAGMFCILIAAGLYIRTGQNQDNSHKQISRAELTETLKKILDLIETEYSKHGVVDQDTIDVKFNDIGPSEMFYRLEYLIFHKFLIKEKTGYKDGKSRYSYKLSHGYAKLMDIKPEFNSIASTSRAINLK